MYVNSNKAVLNAGIRSLFSPPNQADFVRLSQGPLVDSLACFVLGRQKRQILGGLRASHGMLRLANLGGIPFCFFAMAQYHFSSKPVPFGGVCQFDICKAMSPSLLLHAARNHVA